MNFEQGILNVEVKENTSTFKIPCSIFDIQSLLSHLNYPVILPHLIFFDPLGNRAHP